MTTTDQLTRLLAEVDQWQRRVRSAFAAAKRLDAELPPDTARMLIKQLSDIKEDA
jgi:hypothetical protein